MLRRNFVLAVTCSLLSTAALAEMSWPSRPVKVVVGYAAGGTTDVIARLVAKELATQLGQPFIVDNRPGANSNLGTEIAARSPSDGYTVLLATISNATNATMYKNSRVNVRKDLTPVATIGLVPNVLVLPIASPIKTLEEYVAYARANPGKMTFASAGSGSSIHLSGELFKVMAKVDMIHVPYRGSSPAITDLLGGQVGSMFDNLPSALPHIKAGKLRALAVTGPARVPGLDVPTVAESGFPGFESYSWTGMMVPAGTSSDIVAKLSSAFAKLHENAELVEQMRRIGAAPMQKSPEQFAKFLDAEIQKWAAVIERSGAKID